MKYKVGDKVKIKSIDWWDNNKINGRIACKYFDFVKSMAKFCGKVVTIDSAYINFYIILEDNEFYRWTDDMIEGLVEDETSIKLAGEAIKNDEMVVSIDEWNLPQGYQFKDENGNVINTTKIVLEKIKKEYPKTYEECCEVLELEDDEIYINVHITNIEISENKKFGTFIRLIRCRNAYWKIYGEKMGLGKPWGT